MDNIYITEWHGNKRQELEVYNGFIMPVYAANDIEFTPGMCCSVLLDFKVDYPESYCCEARGHILDINKQQFVLTNAFLENGSEWVLNVMAYKSSKINKGDYLCDIIFFKKEELKKKR